MYKKSVSTFIEKTTEMANKETKRVNLIIGVMYMDEFTGLGVAARGFTYQ